jgi:hypothetical protein
MIQQPPFDRGEQFIRESGAHRDARLAPYRDPASISPAIKRGLALEDAIDSTQRAVFAVVDASRGLERDEPHVIKLRDIYADLRLALRDLEELKAGDAPTV